ncbi:carbohydrate ABC transporter permease [Saccharomonospora azurea]|uniref:ABC-type sugar transport system, permease component n=1 Tax=Saccharomonospora azurea NA-128 TaxID=882081 RepID=H8G6D0_9PSEU|nr:carbohydrate ABC transporter permease [Saccharomonospora azurea]EHY88273.1 ABC-type sugar transport system, permease component [Saccharomonospora azurea NA-128]
MTAVSIPDSGVTGATRPPRGRRTWRARVGTVVPHVILLAYVAVACAPIALIVMNAFKSRQAIFEEPFAFPTPATFDLSGFETVFARADFELYFLNSFIVTVSTVFLVLLLGSMLAFALAEYRFAGLTALALYMAVGIMIPIRLGTVGILDLMVDLSLVNSLAGLVLVYTAMGLPLAVFVLTAFFKQVPDELKDAARIDGAGEYRVYSIVLPLVRPGLAAIGVYTMLPIWNDLWFPLILTPAENVRTVTLGTQLFLGQFVTDWNAVLAVLSLAALPMLALFIIFSRQFVRGLTSGAIK